MYTVETLLLLPWHTVSSRKQHRVQVKDPDQISQPDLDSRDYLLYSVQTSRSDNNSTLLYSLCVVRVYSDNKEGNKA